MIKYPEETPERKLSTEERAFIEKEPATDTERLDWLTRHDVRIARSRDGDCYWLHWPYGKDGDGRVLNGSPFNTAREAIDDEITRRALPTMADARDGARRSTKR